MNTGKPNRINKPKTITLTPEARKYYEKAQSMGIAPNFSSYVSTLIISDVKQRLKGGGFTIQELASMLAESDAIKKNLVTALAGELNMIQSDETQTIERARKLQKKLQLAVGNKKKQA